ncbi:MAG: discoidin domain-containing protein [Prolixibacteraceae bacterium]|nr:discoidin domain-containing protein [Prolixibacteraceae bacterium]
MKKIFLLFIILTFNIFGLSAKHCVYISALGDGRNTGTKEQLLASLTGARDRVRQLRLVTSMKPPTITIDGRDNGRTFDGFGALSAGASSRLLYDYPEPERSQILDYLFKPGYGANLQILKVEIGGDSNGTSGCEPSHMRTPMDLNGERGYEWWLMKQAKDRNPDIKLWGLQWSAPAWFKGGFWSQDNIRYLLAWLKLAEDLGLKIDYMGGWNERKPDTSWFIAWHKALARHYPHIKIVGTDGIDKERWTVVDEMSKDPDFYTAIDIIGVHDPYGARTGYEHCPVPIAALQSDKKIWDSELSAQGHDVGAVPLARALNRQYIEGRMTANITYSLVSAWYADLPIADTGLMLATRPWSGCYRVGKNIWVQAHTTQFTHIGWQYIDNACGYLPNGVSYVSLKSPDSRDFTTVIETMDAPGSQLVEFEITGGLPDNLVHLWFTDLSSADSNDYFAHQQPISPKAGSFSLVLLPRHIYTITTTTGQSKGAAQSKAGPEEQMPLPYKEDFESYGVGRLARYFTDLGGAFETAPCTGGRSGLCYRQVLTNGPIPWGPGAGKIPPTTLMGDPCAWGDYEVGTDILLEQEGYVELLGRISAQRGAKVAGYHLRINSDGQWTLYSQDLDQPDTNLASGKVGFNVGTWHRLGLRFLSSKIEVLFDGRVVGKSLDDRNYTGQVGLQVMPWRNARFDNISLTKTGPWPSFVPHAQMKATATSEHTGNIGGYDYAVVNAIDDRPETAWGAEWQPKASLPQSITFDLGCNETVHGLVYQPLLPRIWGAIVKDNEKGYITSYRVWLSRDGKKFVPAAQGIWPATCSTKIAVWPGQKTRYVRLEALEAANGSPMAGEIYISTSPLTGKL